MNRASIARNLLVLEQVAKKAYAQAARLREQLEADARAEYAEQGTAPSWNMPDLGRLVLPITKDAVYVADEAALIDWLQEHYPQALTTTIRPGSLRSLLATVDVVAFDDRDDVEFLMPSGVGGSIPGLAVRPGGQPKALTFTPTKDATVVVGAAADQILAKVAAELGIALVDNEPGEVTA